MRKTPLAASVLGVAVGKARAAFCVLASDAPTRRHAGEGKWSQHEQTEERPFAKSGRGFWRGEIVVHDLDWWQADHDLADDVGV